MDPLVNGGLIKLVSFACSPPDKEEGSEKKEKRERKRDLFFMPK